MNVGLVSEDHELLKLCREVIADISDDAWSVSPARGDSDGESADLWLWDYLPGQVLPKTLSSNPTRHLFLVQRQDLNEFRTLTGTSDTHVLLSRRAAQPSPPSWGPRPHRSTNPLWVAPESRSRRDSAVPDSGQPKTSGI